MSVAGEYFLFSTTAPSLETIYEAICEVEGTPVPRTMRRDPTQPVDPQHIDKPGSMLFAGDELNLRGPGKRYLIISVSLDGQTIGIFGNALGLLKSSCIALTKLGGTAGRPASLSSRGQR
jgi:hypothetical protein